jgi:hypothetical protein
MERAIVFFLAIIFLASILYLYPTSEGFECGSMATLENKLVTDTDKNTENRAVNPELAQAGFGTIEPSPAPPTDLPIARIEERAKGAPLPYRDPATEPAKYIRLNGMLQDLQAFIAFQSQSLADQCDPNIQLPLTTARSDLTRLQNSISVLNRNPGMQSKITNQQVRGMQDNLNYLKDEIRNLENSGAIKETFVGSQSQDDTKTPATLASLKEFDAKVLIEKARIGASGTTDISVQARISALDRIDQDIRQIIQQVEGGRMDPKNIPIMKTDLDQAFPNLGDITKPLPRQLMNSGLPPYVANLFPGGLSSTDTSTLNALRDALKNYSANPNGFTETMSKIFNLNNPSTDSTARDANLLSMNNYNLGQNSSSSGSTVTSPPSVEQVFGVRGLPGANNKEPEQPGFDWKERGRIIGQRIFMRGLDPKDFGVINSTDEVSADFSWRGYTKMICSRLMNTMDPGLPEYCGCPPYNWNGWTD